MMRTDSTGTALLEGPAGSLPVAANDEITRKLCMLIEGECEGLGSARASAKFGYSKGRYYQLLEAYRAGGAAALASAKRGPKRLYRRTNEAQRQVIRYRFLDPDVPAPVIAQKMRQCGWAISTRSVARVIADFGLQKKTPRRPAR